MDLYEPIIDEIELGLGEIADICGYLPMYERVDS